MSKIYHKGIDVSEFQGNIDWTSVKNAGIEFVIPRTGYGYHTDKIFNSVVSRAKVNNIDIPAVYHFSYATDEASAKKEADYAINLVKVAGLPKSTIIFYDFEYDSKRYFEDCWKKDGKKCTAEIVQKFTDVFCDRVREAGYVAGVYANQDYYINYYNNGKALKSYNKFWLADLEGEPNYPCDFRQYSHTGKVSGIAGNVDLNHALYEYKDSVTPTEEKTETPKLDTETLAKEVIAGKWGNGDERKRRLTEAGYDYTVIQNRVNELMAASNSKKSVTDAVVTAVIRGDYGNGDERKQKLEAEGYVYKEVQDAVNKKLSGENTNSNITKVVSPAQSHDPALSGDYIVTATSLNLRYIPGLLTTNNVVKVLTKGTVLKCWGYYTQKENSKWLLVQLGSTTGFVDSSFVKRK